MKDCKRYGAGDKDEKSANGAQISIGKFPSGKMGLHVPFRNSITQNPFLISMCLFIDAQCHCWLTVTSDRFVIKSTESYDPVKSNQQCWISALTLYSFFKVPW